MPLRLATRGSAQAMAQSGVVADALRAQGHEVELVIVETTGDRRTDVPLHVIGGQGVFVKEVQQSVLDGFADLAVHSAKDLPSASQDGLVIGAFCERRSVADALVGRSLADLASGAEVATGSVRRRAQLAAVRPDLTFVELRGNIATRLSKVPDGGAIVMAVAAMEVLGLTDRIAESLDPAWFVPAVGQGCVAVECRADDPGALAALDAVDHPETRAAVETERAFLAAIGSGCSLPVGAWSDGRMLQTFLAGASVWREAVVLTGRAADDRSIAADAASRALAAVGPP
jgi:hydroxymethylbilane synthase